MKILAHRGFWLDPEEKNTRVAFQRALDHGFGIETDVRDFQGDLVISHDFPTGHPQSYEDFLDQIGDSDVPIAVNIKSDGLSNAIHEFHEVRPQVNSVFFDMSGPEHFQYKKRNLRTLNRISEFESGFNFESPDFGIWLDAFMNDSWRIEWLHENPRVKNVFVVSPELHGRQHLEFWRQLRELPGWRNFFLCTDFPIEAQKWFGDPVD